MSAATDVFVSSLLAERHPSLRTALGVQLARFGVALHEITGTRDIWCRDYMPVSIADRRFVQFRYEPDYLDEAPELITPSRVANQVSGDVRRSRLVVDGGNIARRGAVAVVTEKVFVENSHVSRNQVKHQLSAELEVDRLIVIPIENGDLFGHADGVVHLLDERSALVNDYSKIDRGYGKAVSRALRAQGVEPIPVPYAPDLETRCHTPPATGVYVNLLETALAMFVPIYNIASDELALTRVGEMLQGRALVAIDCSRAAREGGSLHCLTWTGVPI